MNKGASVALGEILVFLHADTFLPYNAFALINDVMNKKSYVAGAFDLKIGSERLIFKLIGRAASIRSRLTRTHYGDQAIFIKRDYFTNTKKCKFYS